MGKGYCLCIGLNSVDPIHYQGWNGKLNAPEKDANDMAALAKNSGFNVDKILGSDATRENVVMAIENASESLFGGDIFFLYYSAHGGQLPDFDNDEVDSLDETWCLYNGQLLDDELKQLWTKFRSDVRILVISDSCHSGTVTKEKVVVNNLPSGMEKAMPIDIAFSTYIHNKEYYDNYIATVDHAKANMGEEKVKACVKLISGCQDNQSSYDGFFNSKFTEQLLVVWNGGKFNGSYSKFHSSIQNKLPQYQSPNLFTYGTSNIVFDNQIPFTI